MQMDTRLYFLVGLLLVNSCCRANAESGAEDTMKPLVEIEDLDTVEQRVKNLETSLEDFEKQVENRLEYGGKRYQTVLYNGKLLKTSLVYRYTVSS